jgi:predicted O-methyltransferase YrrM
LHGIHSPFVFYIQHEIINEKIPFYAFDDIESVRAKLLLSQQEIKVKDLGAGSQNDENKKLKINQIARRSLKAPKDAQLLFRLAYHFKPKSILELGTSLGITTAYLAKACPSAKIISIEGAPSVAKVATVNLKKLNVFNVKQQVGAFEDELKPAINSLEKLDFVFFDGNHRYQSTLNYFESCLPLADENSIFIFDDIYWSKEMHSAWKKIKKHPAVTVTIDVYSMGIVFFKKDQAKEEFTVYH